MGLRTGYFTLIFHSPDGTSTTVRSAALGSQYLSGWTRIFDASDGDPMWCWHEPPDKLHFELKSSDADMLSMLFRYHAGLTRTRPKMGAKRESRLAKRCRDLGIEENVVGGPLADGDILGRTGYGDAAIPADLRRVLIARGRIQAAFRNELMVRWKGVCAFCGCSIRSALEAAHLVPWAKCDSDESRLDPSNGLLLCATHHRMFDAGEIAIEPCKLEIRVRFVDGSGTEAARSIDRRSISADSLWRDAFVDFLRLGDRAPPE